VCGPTASGKSGLALALAQRLHAPILSADSRQVYRHFDSGTAKPTAAERHWVPHYLIDICEPTETLTVADFQDQAKALIQHFQGQEIVPLLVGGTGLYIKSIVRGMRIPRVPPQPELRSQLAQLGQQLCYELLRSVDPAAIQKVHPNDSVRTLRALEVFYTTGLPMSAQQGESPPTYPILHIGLDCLEPTEPGCDPLTERIRTRTYQMVKQGFVAEVEALCARYGEDLPLLKTLGYQEMRQHLAGELSLEEAIAQTTLHTRQFAKRQRTWFRADPSIEWFDANHPDLLEQVWQRIQIFLENIGSKA
jgi:tRNA dimethylallyltransferase